MNLHMRPKLPTPGLKNAAIAALVSALDDEKSQAKEKRGLTGVRAVATGAAIYTAGLGAYKGQRFVREQLSSNRHDDHVEDVQEDEEALDAQELDDAEAENEVIDDMESENEPEASEDEEEPEADRGGRGAGGITRTRTSRRHPRTEDVSRRRLRTRRSR